jgi:hypothetical protein
MQITPQKVEIDIPNNERVKEPKKQRKPALTCPNKTSLWFVTINSNIFLNDKSENEAKNIKNKFVGALEEILHTFDKFVEMKTSKLGIKYGYAENDPREILCKNDRILEHKLDWVLELSPSGKLHAHIMFYLKKKGVDTKLMITEIKNAINSKLNISCYVNYRLSPSMMTLEDYMRKNPLDN